MAFLDQGLPTVEWRLCGQRASGMARIIGRDFVFLELLVASSKKTLPLSLWFVSLYSFSVMTTALELPPTGTMSGLEPIAASAAIEIPRLVDVARLGSTVTVKFPRALGFELVSREQSATLYRTCGLPLMCAALIARIEIARVCQQTVA